MKTLILAFFLIAGCVSTPVNQAPAPTPAPAGWTYNAFVAAHLTPEMLAAKPGDLCPNANNMGLTQFWQAMVYATVDAESGGNPNDDYKESFASDSGTAQVSSGLLQLSLDDAKRGGNCAGLSSANIHDPQTNLKCGIEIMADLLGTRSTMRASLGRYWSTIRDGKTDAKVKAILPGCFQ